MRLKGKVAFITAAAGGIGSATAKRFAAEGARLVLTDISHRRLSEVEGELSGACELIGEAGDALDQHFIAGLVGQAMERFERIDILVNVVGGVASKKFATPMLEIDDAQLEATLAFNLKGIFATARQVVPLMQRQRYGRIVNISSTSMAGESGHADYSAAKGGVAGLTRTMAIEFAPDITVNAIAPWLIRTPLMKQLVDQTTMDGWTARKPPLQRFGEPEDIANAALFLASDEASFITGINLPVTGGFWPNL